ncbi:hypothetical protein B0J13DRAFT_399129, partial [Dactylonectria estremocensis]
KLPNYSGISEYKGTLRDISDWDSSLDFADKRVAVISNGASGVQIVPNLQRTVSHNDHYSRNKTLIA